MYLPPRIIPFYLPRETPGKRNPEKKIPARVRNPPLLLGEDLVGLLFGLGQGLFSS